MCEPGCAWESTWPVGGWWPPQLVMRTRIYAGGGIHVRPAGDRDEPAAVRQMPRPCTMRPAAPRTRARRPQRRKMVPESPRAPSTGAAGGPGGRGGASTRQQHIQKWRAPTNLGCQRTAWGPLAAPRGGPKPHYHTTADLHHTYALYNGKRLLTLTTSSPDAPPGGRERLEASTASIMQRTGCDPATFTVDPDKDPRGHERCPDEVCSGPLSGAG